MYSEFDYQDNRDKESELVDREQSRITLHSNDWCTVRNYADGVHCFAYWKLKSTRNNYCAECTLRYIVRYQVIT